ncbi:MAG TPA: hypothetical protein VNX68_18500 [Nitrosopumilaceae archaeon]|jgi:hypothetical protein|nr:hypothetical protein [Nitrosopumilaceae archaeon]
MAKDQITSGEWMTLKQSTRNALVAIFGIPRSGFAQTVTDATGHSNFITDGYNHKDLSVITFDRLLSYLQESKPEDNVHTLFLKTVERIENPPAMVEIETVIKVEKEKVQEPKTYDYERNPFTEDPGPDGFKCELCAYATANPKALHLHRVAKHKNR